MLASTQMLFLWPSWLTPFLSIQGASQSPAAVDLGFELDPLAVSRLSFPAFFSGIAFLPLRGSLRSGNSGRGLHRWFERHGLGGPNDGR